MCVLFMLYLCSVIFNFFLFFWINFFSMARNNATFLYNGIGNVGDVQLTNWKGKSVIKRRRRHVGQPGTLAQLCTWAKLRISSKLGKLCKPTILTGFRMACGGQMTEMNKYMSLNYDAFTCTDGEVVTIDWAALVFSMGDLLGIRSGANAVRNGGVYDLALGDYVMGEGAATDKLAVVVIDEVNKLAYNNLNVTTRDQNAATITLPVAMSGTKHVYAFYYNVQTHVVSNSMKLPIA